MRRRLLVATAVALLVGLGAGPVAAQEPAAPADPLVSVRPGLAGVTTLDQGHYRYDVPAGTTLTDSIQVINERDAPLEVDLYPADLVTATGGGLAPRQRDDDQLEVGDWIEVEADHLTLAPNEEREVPFTIVVPEGSVPGDYLGAVVASVVAGRSPTGVSIETRAALTVDVRVPGVANLGAAVGPLTHERDGDAERFTVDLGNDGNVLFTARGRIEVRDGGRVVATLPLEPAELYVIPDGEAAFTATWDDLPLLGRRTAVAVFDLDVRGEDPTEVRSDGLDLTYVPVPLLVAAGLLLAILTVGWRATRGRRRRRREIRDEARRIVEDRRRAAPADELVEAS